MADEKQKNGAKKELLTPEQEAMWKSRHRNKTKTMGPDQKKEFNKGLRQKLKKMSDDELAKTRAALQGEWDALPANRKEKLQQKIAGKGEKGTAATG